MSKCDSGRRVTFWCHNHGSPWRVGQDGCDFARAEKAEAAIQRVRELHHFVVDEIETREGPEDVQHCAECGYIPTDEEPCPTIRILDGESDE